MDFREKDTRSPLPQAPSTVPAPKPAIDSLADLRNNSLMGKEGAYQPHDLEPLTPLQKQYLRLGDLLDNSPKPSLRVLDEYFTIGEQAHKQEAQRGGEDQKKNLEIAQNFEELQKGSSQDKWLYCMVSRKRFLEEAQQYQQTKQTKLAKQSRQKAHNWEERASAVLEQAKEQPRQE